MTLSISCRCGTSRILVSGIPVLRAYCHSQACRELFGGVVSALAAWRRSEVDSPAGARALACCTLGNRQSTRHFCAACGDILFAEDALGFRLIPGPALAHAGHGTVPERFAPIMHVNYSQRQFDVADSLPKYLERPGGPMYDGLRAPPRPPRSLEIPVSMQQVRAL